MLAGPVCRFVFIGLTSDWVTEVLREFSLSSQKTLSHGLVASLRRLGN